MSPATASRQVDVLVVGAGQAGLGTAYWLRRLAPELSVLVVDAAPAVGDSWVQRWDSLRLFTPRHFSALPGAPFPAGPDPQPGRLEMADYLQRYAARFDLPVEVGVRVSRLRRDAGSPVADTLLAETSAGPVLARHVVLACGPFQDPFVPAAAAGLSKEVQQLHSYDYRRPADLRGEQVLVVGGGNSAAQLTLELARDRRVTLVTPEPPWFVPERILGVSSYWWMSALGVLRADADGWLARYVRRRGDAVFGRQLVGPIRRGKVELLSSPVVSAADREVVLADGTRRTVTAVLWCTGFHARYDWVELDGALGADGGPVHTAGASPVAGLHWMGLPWQDRLDSSIIHGVGPDARRTARRIAAQPARAGRTAVPG